MDRERERFEAWFDEEKPRDILIFKPAARLVWSAAWQAALSTHGAAPAPVVGACPNCGELSKSEGEMCGDCKDNEIRGMKYGNG